MYLAGVHAVGAVHLAIGAHDLVIIEKAAQRHRDIHAHRAMPLGKDEAVAPRIFDVGRVNVQPVVEQTDQQVGHRQVAADMYGTLVYAA